MSTTIRLRGARLYWGIALSTLLLFAFHQTGLANSNSEDSAPPIAKQVYTLFQNQCYDCHGDPSRRFSAGLNLLDMQSLASHPSVDLQNPEQSLLYEYLRDGIMPELAPPLPESEINLVLEWIRAGAPAYDPNPITEPLIPLERHLELEIMDHILEDTKFLTPQQASDFRYFTFSHLLASGESQAQLDLYRQGLFKLMNSLSWQSSMVFLTPIDEDRTIYRLSLSEIGWDEEKWNRVVAAYVYGIEFDQLIYNIIIQGVFPGTKTPYVRADWFITEASRPPLYHDLLELPETDVELEQLLGINVAENIRDANVQRSAFSISGVARSNRMIERHRTDYGVYWKSYDFSSNSGEQDLFSHPLSPLDGGEGKAFSHAGGEMIFNLPNGLQGYLIVSESGKRIDSAPVEVVQDNTRSDATVVNGVSCMHCHQNGIRERFDEMLEYANAVPGLFGNDIEKIRSLYTPENLLAQSFREDRQRFEDALARIGVQEIAGEVETIKRVVSRFEQRVDLISAAAELGIRVSDFAEAAEQNAEVKLIYLRLRRNGVPRDKFIDVFKDLVTLLGIGKSYEVDPPAVLDPPPIAINGQQLALGKEHSCFLNKEGKVQCWGYNVYRQSAPPEDLTNVTQISAGNYHSCAIADGQVRCWGRTSTIDIPRNLKNPKQVASGSQHACVLSDSGVQCWGRNAAGQTDVPNGLRNPTQVAAGTFHSCAITDDGVRCWGDDSSGQSSPPNNLGKPTQISTGGNHTCALTDRGVRCWGINKYGQTDVPENLNNPAQISTGRSHTCALTRDGVLCWGDNSRDQANPPRDLKNPTQIAAGNHHTCALTDDGVRCWGGNNLGQIDVPENLRKTRNKEQLALGGEHSCFLGSDSRVQCWGDNFLGQTEVPENMKNVEQISTGTYHSCAVSEGQVQCWGNEVVQSIPEDLNHPAQIASGLNYACAISDNRIRCWGDGRAGQTDVPADLKKPIQIATGFYHVCALTSDGVQCWGENSSQRATPPEGLEDITQVASGRGHSCAITGEGVRCWGLNNYGQTEVPTDLKNPKQIASGHYHNCALTQEGVQCWGRNSYGQSDPPFDLKNPIRISAGEKHTCALTDDGVQCWGFGGNGQTDVPENLVGFRE